MGCLLNWSRLVDKYLLEKIELITQIWENETIPSEWTEGIVVYCTTGKETL